MTAESKRGPVTAWVVLGVSAVAALFHMYAAGVQPFTALVQRPVHLALMSVLGFLGVGVQVKIRSDDAPPAPWKERVSAILGLTIDRRPTTAVPKVL